MKIIPSQLAGLEQRLGTTEHTVIAGYLTNLGFETEIIASWRNIFEVSVTPNRADGMSHLGLARDLRAFMDRDEQTTNDPLVFHIENPLDNVTDIAAPGIKVQDGVASQYHYVLLESVVIQASPQWLQQALEDLGLHPINNVVDVTNYLMELYGQPLHAFDADSIQGDMIVRASKAGETLETLDGTVHTLPDGVAVIADDTGLIDLAGIRGGKTSEIRPDTKRVLLQSAIFDRSRIRRAVTALQYRTTASTRFERGVDPAISQSVLAEAVRLLSSPQFGSARATGKQLILIDKGKRETVSASAAAISKLLGLDIPAERQAHLLRLLGCDVAQDGDSLTVTPPTWRFDLTIWQDLAEEVARLTGLDDTIPATPLPPAAQPAARAELEWAEALKDRLTAIGLSEVQTYSFISRADMERFDLQSAGELANPLNPELAFLRPSLMPNLATVIATNGLVDPINVFEVGHVFSGTDESVNLCIGLSSTSIELQNWIEKLAKVLEINADTLKKKLVVRELDQGLKDAYKIRKQSAVLLEIPLADLQKLTSFQVAYRVPTEIVRYRAISKFPPVTRDIALVVDRSVSVADVIKAMTDTDSHVEAADLFDEFTSDKLGQGKKSLAFHIYYADPNRTLTNDEVTPIHSRVTQHLVDSFQASIR